jgi:hypothetical protein
MYTCILTRLNYLQVTRNMVLFLLSTHLHTSIANNISLIGYATATATCVLCKFTGYGDRPLEDPSPPALNLTKCVSFQKYRVDSSHGASTSATVDVHGDRPHGR